MEPALADPEPDTDNLSIGVGLPSIVLAKSWENARGCGWRYRKIQGLCDIRLWRRKS
jgi:hypothetical protein